MSAVRSLQDAPAPVICVLLSRPSGWADCMSISKTVSTGLRRHLAVFRGQYTRNQYQEDWVNRR
eukprot:10067257-Alexandrium_andersonii.AAC.1